MVENYLKRIVLSISAVSSNLFYKQERLNKPAKVNDVYSIRVIKTNNSYTIKIFDLVNKYFILLIEFRQLESGKIDNIRYNIRYEENNKKFINNFISDLYFNYNPQTLLLRLLCH